MGKKKIHEEYEAELAIKNPTVKVVEQYINTYTPILHHCLTHDIFWATTPGRALTGVGCEECRIEKFRNVRCKTHEQYVKDVAEVNSDIVVVGQYTDAKTQLDFYCKKHSVMWKTYPYNVLRGCGCPECGKDKISNKNKKTHDEYVSNLTNINPNIDVLEEYISANIPILHRCKIDGFEWYARPGNILFGKGCPKCNESHGEKYIRQWLIGHHINYVCQKTFCDCKNQRPLPFDFYLPEYNCCIEYDGEQHFRAVEYFGGEDAFAQRIHNDEIKTAYCANNNIGLLRIPYNKNAEEELEKFFIHLI